jgi:hypothetical protein
VSIEESPAARERRAWVERQERFKDLQKEYELRSAAAPSPEERRQLAQVFSEQRRAHRDEDVRLGRRSPGLAVQMHQIMWARWIEVAVEHELEARRAYLDIGAKPESDAILREFRASLVAVTAAAHTIEAVFGDIKYLIPPQSRRDKRHQELRHGFRVAFGVSGATDEQLSEEFRWLCASGFGRTPLHRIGAAGSAPRGNQHRGRAFEVQCDHLRARDRRGDGRPGARGLSPEAIRSLDRAMGS